MSWLGNLFGTERATKAAADLLDGVQRGVDALVLTDEERVKYDQKGYELWLKTLEITRDENSARSLTRRYLALIIIGFYSLLILTASVVYPLDKDYSHFLFTVADSKFGSLVVGIALFYFGPVIKRIWAK